MTRRAARARGLGVVLGKFMPPHLGHKLLIDFARGYVDDLTVMVGSLPDEPIPGHLRYAWMRQLFPDARVIHLTDPNPQHPHEHPDFWDIWRESMLARLPRRPDYLFASEEYGWRLAQELGAQYIPVDQARAVVPISATALRQAPWRHWRYLPDVVRPYFVGRVCVFGPESTGKSTLTAALAQRYQTVYAPEYARAHLEPRQGQLAYEDMGQIARGHAALCDALATQANRLLFMDTDLLATTLWSDALFGRCEPWILHEAARQRPALTLLTDIDVPWVPDPVRYLPHERERFMARCEQALKAHERPYVKLSGSWEARMARAVEAVDALLDATP